MLQNALGLPCRTRDSCFPCLPIYKDARSPSSWSLSFMIINSSAFLHTRPSSACSTLKLALLFRSWTEPTSRRCARLAPLLSQLDFWHERIHVSWRLSALVYRAVRT